MVLLLYLDDIGRLELVGADSNAAALEGERGREGAVQKHVFPCRAKKEIMNNSGLVSIIVSGL